MKKILGDTRLMLKCCVMYYENQMGQNEIAKKLGISRQTVSKLLKEAKERGYLRIEIVGPEEQNCYKLEKRLEEQYTCSEIIETIRNMNLYKANELGYLPAYTRTDITDTLHEKFGFRTDNEITTIKIFKKILKDLKK